MTLAITLSAFSSGFLSGLIPVVNAELVLVGLAVSVPPAMLPLAVVGIATGQMIAKAFLYVTGDKLVRERLHAQLVRWRLVGVGARSGPAVVGVSALVGVPPFYLVSVAASGLGVRFRTFVLLGLCGRLLRFGALAAAPALFLNAIG